MAHFVLMETVTLWQEVVFQQAPERSITASYTGIKSHDTRRGLSCFKYGQAHWKVMAEIVLFQIKCGPRRWEANCTPASGETGKSSAPGTTGSLPTSAVQVITASITQTPKVTAHGTATGPSCFKYGQGHWAANCTFASLETHLHLVLVTSAARQVTCQKIALEQFGEVGKENGGCGFFKWCDNASGAAYMPNMSSDSGSSSQFLDLLCPCEAGSCLILNAKRGAMRGNNSIGVLSRSMPSSNIKTCLIPLEHTANIRWEEIEALCGICSAIPAAE